MGPQTTAHMLFGAFVGWGLLSPLAKKNGWAPGPVGDWAGGSRGWIVWVSLAVMLADSIISLAGIILEPFIRIVLNKRHAQRRGSYQRLSDIDEEPEIGSSRFPGLRRRKTPSKSGDQEDEPEQDARPEDLVPMPVVVWGLIASGILCIVTIGIVFGQVPLYATITAFFLALVLSVMGVRALGNPFPSHPLPI